MDKIKKDENEINRDRFHIWSSLISTLIGMLGSLISSFSLFGIKELNLQQIIILSSLFLGIVVVALTIKTIQKNAEKTRIATKKIVHAYLTQIDNTAINPAVKNEF